MTAMVTVMLMSSKELTHIEGKPKHQIRQILCIILVLVLVHLVDDVM